MNFDQLIKEGIPFKVTTDVETSFYFGLSIFLGMVLALAVYAKLLR